MCKDCPPCEWALSNQLKALRAKQVSWKRNCASRLKLVCTCAWMHVCIVYICILHVSITYTCTTHIYAKYTRTYICSQFSLFIDFVYDNLPTRENLLVIPKIILHGTFAVLHGHAWSSEKFESPDTHVPFC